MGKIDEIVDAVSNLSSRDLARFRSWFERFDAARFDQKIERDIAAGHLDRLAEAALAEHRDGLRAR